MRSRFACWIVLAATAIAVAAAGGRALPVIASTAFQERAAVNWSKTRILVFTRNGKGYVHDNIPNSIDAIKALGRDRGFAVDATEDPAVFSDDRLKQYNALVFSNTNNAVFDTDAQRVALMRYVQSGGGFAAIHSASGTERSWKWFAALVGGRFSRHPPFQKFTVRILDPTHPSVAHLPAAWEKEDECYYLVHMSVNLRVIAVNDLTTIKDPKGEPPETFGTVFPSVWYQEFDGGRQWYTSLGHHKDDYNNPDFRRHLLGGIQSVVRNTPLDYRRAYAQSPADEPRRR